MSGLRLRRGLWIALVLSVLGLCLFGDCTAFKSSGVLGAALTEIAAVLADPGTQWMVFVCTGIYFLGFVVLRRRLAGRRGGEAAEGGGWRIVDRASSLRTAWGLGRQWLVQPAFWLSDLLVLAAVAYALDYPAAAKSTAALTLLGVAMLGQGAAACAERSPKSNAQRQVGE